MPRTDNYQIQAQQAKQCFLRYDQQQLIAKLDLQADSDYLYTELISRPYRIHRATGDLQRLEQGQWQSANSFGEVMTLLDLVCDSRSDRYLSHRWKQMTAFGLMFHQELLEEPTDAFLVRVREDPRALDRACRVLKGQPMKNGDVSFALPLFEGLSVWLQFWEGDEEFPSRLRWLWDENALMYLKYETMYFALGLLKARILEIMKEEPA